MSLFERMIGAVSPKWAYAREAWRAAADQLRGYDAGNNGDRLNSGWRVANQSAAVSDRVSRDTLRARARDLERNSDILGGVVTSFERNVVGSGLRLQAKTDNDDLNARLEELWHEWCRPRNCDVSGVQSLNELCIMALRRKIVDGGVLILKRYMTGGVIPLRLQYLDMDELDTSQIVPQSKDHRVVDGVEIDRYGRHRGYWIRQYSADGLMQISAVYIDANDAIFYWTRTRPSQIREVSGLAPTLSRIRDINEFMTAVSVKERVAACFGLAIKRYNPAPVNGPGRTVRGEEKKDSPYRDKTVEPGMIMELEPGDEIQPVTPASQGSSAADFVRLQQRLVGAGMGLGYETISRDMSQVNYSSARQGLIEDSMTYAIERQAFCEHVLDEIYESFVISCIVSGALSIGDFWQHKRMYMRHQWTPPGKPWIDPVKEATANLTAVVGGFKTFMQVAAENGRDWREQIDEIAEVQEYAASKGVQIGGMTHGGGQALPSAGQDDGDDTKQDDGGKV